MKQIIKKVNNRIITWSKVFLGHIRKGFIHLIDKAYLHTTVTIGIAALVVVVLITLSWLYTVEHSFNYYGLSKTTMSLLGKPDSRLMKLVTYDGSSNAYYLDKNAIDQPAPLDVTVGSNSAPGQSGYGFKLPTDLSQGTTVYDNALNLSFSMTPLFNLGGGKMVDGHFIYPMSQYMAQDIYTVKNNGLQENIILNKFVGSHLSFKYRLQLPSSLVARITADGSIGIYSISPALLNSHMSYGSSADQQKMALVRQKAPKNYLLFLLPAPTITPAMKQGSVIANYSIKGNILTLALNNIGPNNYPVSIDPSVIVSPANSFLQNGNNDGGVNITAGQVSVAGLTGGGVYGNWAQNLPYPTYDAASVVYNGYIYEIGGTASSTSGYTASVYYAAINSDGSLGAWLTTTSLPYYVTYSSSVAYNGYVYVLGGYSNGSTSATVYYALINSNGTLGGWNTTTSLPVDITRSSSVVYNGYVYEIGGYVSGGTTTVYYSQIGTGGTLGSWSTTTALPSASYDNAVAVNGSYVYLVGGFSAGALSANSIYAQINSNGTLGSWTSTTALPQALVRSAVSVYNGYIYINGGSTSSSAINYSYYAQINSNGTIGTWNMSALVINVYEHATSVVNNGYLYIMGGYTGSALLNTVEYSPIEPNGNLLYWYYSNSWIMGTLPQETAEASMVVYDGFVYEIGCSSSFSSVYFAQVQSNGLLGTWNATTALPQPTINAAAEVYDGYLYIIGGENGSSTYYSSVYFAPINSDGTLGSWSSTTPLPQTDAVMSSTIYNGYIYIIGGDVSGTVYPYVYYAHISSANGVLGSWGTTTQLPSGAFNDSAVTYNNYIYEIGSYSNGYDYYAPINANGTLGNWTTIGSLGYMVYESAVVVNGYVYEIGGENSSNQASTAVYYAQILSNGNLGTWKATTSLPTGEEGYGAVYYNGYIYSNIGVASSSSMMNINKIDSPGTISSWQANTAPSALYDGSSAVSGDYVYYLGGYNGNQAFANVYYAPINASIGTYSSWTSTTALPSPLYSGSVVVCNGFIYYIGGYNAGYQSAVYDAPISSNGTIGSWVTNYSLPQGDAYQSTAVYNGYIYVIGGVDGNVVYYGQSTTNNGLLASNWATTSSLPSNIDQAQAVVNGGYIYDLGGFNTTNASYSTEVFFAPINSNGTLGTWTTTTSEPYSSYEGDAAVYNGYIYSIPGYSQYMYYAPINANGTLGAWEQNSTPITINSSIPYMTNTAYAQFDNSFFVIGGQYGPTAESAGFTGQFINDGNGSLINQALNNVATALPQNDAYASSVAYNGYVYEFGGYNGSYLSSVDFALITSSGALGAWNTTTVLPQTISAESSFAYDGYVYLFGGYNGSTYVSNVYYAPINSNGTLGSWSSANALPQTLGYTSTDVYNGYAYVMGGTIDGSTDSSAVYYASINSNGTLGVWNTTSSLPVANEEAATDIYDGYIYDIGGNSGSGLLSNSYEALINNNGTIGTWNATTSLPQALDTSSAEAYDGYMYILGGYSSSGNSDVVYMADINNNGTVGNWLEAGTLPASIDQASSVVYYGYIYEIGGNNGSSYVSTVYYDNLNVVPRIGYYSRLIDITNSSTNDPNITYILSNGTNLGNLDALGVNSVGGIGIEYAFASNACSTFTTPADINNGNSDQLGVPYKLSFTADGCGTATDLARYIWVRYILDDSTTATFPDVNSNHTTINGITVYYHPASQYRLRGGAAFTNGSLQSLDASP